MDRANTKDANDRDSKGNKRVVETSQSEPSSSSSGRPVCVSLPSKRNEKEKNSGDSDKRRSRSDAEEHHYEMIEDVPPKAPKIMLLSQLSKEEPLQYIEFLRNWELKLMQERETLEGLLRKNRQDVANVRDWLEKFLKDERRRDEQRVVEALGLEGLGVEGLKAYLNGYRDFRDGKIDSIQLTKILLERILVLMKAMGTKAKPVSRADAEECLRMLGEEVTPENLAKLPIPILPSPSNNSSADGQGTDEEEPIDHPTPGGEKLPGQEEEGEGGDFHGQEESHQPPAPPGGLTRREEGVGAKNGRDPDAPLSKRMKLVAGDGDHTEFSQEEK